MLSKLLKKEAEDKSSGTSAQYKDFNSIIPPPEPRTMGILIYRNIELETSDISLPSIEESIDQDPISEQDNEEVVLTEVLEGDESEDLP